MIFNLKMEWNKLLKTELIMSQSFFKRVGQFSNKKYLIFYFWCTILMLSWFLDEHYSSQEYSKVTKLLTTGDLRLRVAGSSGSVFLLSKTRTKLYFLGVIDILTDYSSRKKLEHFFKSMWFFRSRKGVSCVSPEEYQSRFYKFLEKKIT